MKFENTDVWGFEHAIRGARNPMNSWAKSDSYYEKGVDPFSLEEWVATEITIGDNDLNLLQRLIRGGSEHRKYLRQVFVSVDITAPLYWWKEMDTYKIGTTANSTSTMHKLASTPITMDCFEIDDYNKNLDIYGHEPYSLKEIWEDLINACESLRQRYNETKDIRYWKELIRILPESWLQTRTITMNYENLYSIVRQRKGHKLTEWKQFIDWVHTLSYADELIFLDEE